MDDGKLSVNHDSVTLVEMYYRDKFVNSIVFDASPTADMFVSTMQQVLNQRQDFTFHKKVECIYDPGTISDELIETQKGTGTQGTLTLLMRMIDRKEPQ